MEVIPVGSRAVLVEVEDASAAAALAAWARAHGIEADEVVPAARSVLFDGVDPDRFPAVLPDEAVAWDGEQRTVTLPVTYDGPDLAWVAEHWGCSTEEVVARHTAVEFVSAFCGFAPGFAYLAGLPDDLAVPRLQSPRPRLPAGAVGLADTWCGVYPGSSPGGWRLIGRTDVVLWDVGADPPALLAPGTRVRFEAR